MAETNANPVEPRTKTCYNCRYSAPMIGHRFCQKWRRAIPQRDLHRKNDYCWEPCAPPEPEGENAKEVFR